MESLDKQSRLGKMDTGFSIWNVRSLLARFAHKNCKRNNKYELDLMRVQDVKWDWGG
jgi:hypothetical protein